MDRWDVILILIAGYVAIMTLVRLMARRRDQMLDHFREEIVSQIEQQKQTTDQSDDQGRGAA